MQARHHQISQEVVRKRCLNLKDMTALSVPARTSTIDMFFVGKDHMFTWMVVPIDVASIQTARLCKGLEHAELYRPLESAVLVQICFWKMVVGRRSSWLCNFTDLSQL